MKNFPILSPGSSGYKQAVTRAKRVFSGKETGWRLADCDKVSDELPTKVIFRMISGNYPGAVPECLALFPELPGTNNPHTCLNYARNGQHGHGVARCIGRPATPAEYADLKHHLETYLGADSYKLQVVKRFTPSHLAARKAALARL